VQEKNIGADCSGQAFGGGENGGIEYTSNDDAIEGLCFGATDASCKGGE